jgi:hypothetical protein
MKCIDPSAMTPAERLAELGELLAAGVQRFLARESKEREKPRNQQEQLDVVGGVEAPCRATARCPR